MLQIPRNSERFHDFVRELLTENTAKLLAKRATAGVSSRTLKIYAYEFEPVWFAAAKALDGEYQVLLRIVGDGQNSARKVVFGGP